MKQTNHHQAVVLKDLGEGLILRRSTHADSKALAEFNSHIHLTDDRETDPCIYPWTRDLLRGNHPTFHPDDCTIVEDTRTHRIVSSCNLISQTWTYAGIPFGVGRPELVGTHPEYRRHGLIRTQFEVLHQWSAERKEKVQAITGIPWYYRQFGYEMLIPLDMGRFCYVPQNVPQSKKGESEPYRVRSAREQDLAFIAEQYEQGGQRWLVNAVRDEALWRYELSGRSKRSCHQFELCVVETRTGEPVGFFAHSAYLSPLGTISVACYEVKPGISWLDVTPSVLRYLEKTGNKYAQRDRKEFKRCYFGLGIEHPLYEVVPDSLPATRLPYAWYIRVPDVRDFLQTITPVLEQRLAQSPVCGHSGELKLSFYRDGVCLVFEKGCLRSVEKWMPSPEEWGDAGFPDLTFLQLLFGHRTLAELREFFADCWANNTGRALLNALFPKQTSNVWGIA